jgi:peptidoglycan/LPS O-acetylase OafA/YrhL
MILLNFISSVVLPLLATFSGYLYDGDNVTVRVTGVSGLWVLANISFAGMRAQNNPSTGWRILSFIFGFPGTLISFFAVKEGSERAYGIDIPRRKA